MLKIGIGIICLVLSLYAIQWDAQPDKKISVSSIDKNMIKRYLKNTYSFVITDEGAKRLVRKNRVLANEYVSSFLKKGNEKAYATIAIEDWMAKRLVHKIQNSIKLSNEILYSYYKDNIQKYKNPDKVKLDIYVFDSFDKAKDFYEKFKNNSIEKGTRGIKQFIPANRWIEISKLREPIKSYISQSHIKIIPPYIVRKGEVVVYVVKDFQKGKGYKPYASVKSQIKAFLYRQTFDREREKILKKYGL